MKKACWQKRVTGSFYLDTLKKNPTLYEKYKSMKKSQSLLCKPTQTVEKDYKFRNFNIEDK